jgi:hypothetical protein
MVYTEEDVFRDCAKNRKQLVRVEERVYKAVWLALCKWIVELFEKGKGVSITTFMQLTWVPDTVEEEIYGKGGDTSIFRPVWRMSEGFEKSHGLTMKHKSDQRKPEDAVLFVKVRAYCSFLIPVILHVLLCSKDERQHLLKHMLLGYLKRTQHTRVIRSIFQTNDPGSNLYPCDLLPQ